MNSLQDLNNYNTSLSLSYTDLRNPDVLFDRASPTNQSQLVNEASTFDASIGIEITDILNAESANPVYRINVSALSGATVSWPVIPVGCVVVNPSTGVYEISGFKNKTQWDIIKSPRITLPGPLPNAFFGLFNYISTLTYYTTVSGNQTKSWTTSVTVLDVVQLTNPTDFVYTSGLTETIANTPQVINLEPTYPSNTVWTIVGTPSSTLSIVSFSSTSTSGGTFSYNSGNKTFTISGTRAQVNAHLIGLRIASNSNIISFNLVYVLTNNQDSGTDTKVQAIKNTDLKYLDNPISNVIYYVEDANSFAVTGAPQVTDEEYDGTGEYLITVTPSVPSAIVSMTSGGVDGTSTFNSSTKILTITGTRTQVNSHLNAISLVTTVDYDSPFNLSYSVTTPAPRLNQSTKFQTLVCSSNDIEVTNMNVTRSYLANRYNLIFLENTPYISDFDDNDSAVYTVTFNCPFGTWTTDDTTDPINPFSLVGTKSEINAKFSLIRFYPNAGVYSSGTFTYTQYKDGILQRTISVVLNGTNASYSGARIVNFMVSGTWTPTKEDLKYGKISDLLIVGGGGGGSLGGGGGGYVREFTNIDLSNQTYTITVGAGGAAAATQTVTANSGGTTSAFGQSALGGGGGSGSNNAFKGGGSYSSWNNNINSPVEGGNGVPYMYYPYFGSPGTKFYLGGGGAGSGENPDRYDRWPPDDGGRITYLDYYKHNELVNSPPVIPSATGINADTYASDPSSSTSRPEAQAGCGGLGKILGGYFKIPSGSGFRSTSNAGYGFGGGGGAYETGWGSLGQAQYGGYVNTVNGSEINWGKGGIISYDQYGNRMSLSLTSKPDLYFTRSLTSFSTFGSNVYIDRSQSKFGDQSLRIAAGGSYVYSSANSKWNFGTNNFTLEFNVRFYDIGTNTHVPLSLQSDITARGGDWKFIITPDKKLKWTFYLPGATDTSPGIAKEINPNGLGPTLEKDKWYHVVVQRTGNQISLYLDGQVIIQSYDATGYNIGNSISNLNVGGLNTLNFTNGWLDEIRISNISRYNENFGLFAESFNNDVNSLALLHFNYEGAGTDTGQGGKTINDDSNFRDPSIAGGGGGGGCYNYFSVAPPAPGGDGIVRFRITQR